MKPVRIRMLIVRWLVLGLVLAVMHENGAAAEAELAAGREIHADGWATACPREEIRPDFLFDRHGGPDGKGGLRISADEREGLDGCWHKPFPIKGGKYYNFRAFRRTENV